MGVMENIRARLQQGATPSELVAEGYSRSSVYAAQRGLERGTKASGRQRRGGRPAASPPNASNAAPGVVPSLDQDLRNDPEIMELRRELAKAKKVSDEAMLDRVLPTFAVVK